MKFIVQKYGGTSIGQADRMKSVAEIVKESLKNDRVIVALSAMSSYVKAEGTTSRLIEAAEAALAGRDYSAVIDLIEEHHVDAVKKLIKGKNRKKVAAEIDAELDSLKSFLGAISVIGEISPRSHDVIISVGEKLSARLFAALLNEMGVPAVYVNLEQLIDKPFAETSRDFYDYAKKRLNTVIKKCKDRVPVLTGYFGCVPNGIIKSIGRGYTDLTAALSAAAVKARELQIWKEVDGVFSADPRKVKNAKVLSSITPEEAAELTYYGSEVIHPFTMEQVIKAKIPIRIKNALNPELPGTIIDPNDKGGVHEKPATAVTVKRNVSVMNVNSNRMLMAYGFMAKVFNVLAKHGIVIDLISTSEVNISMTIENIEKVNEAVLDELHELGTVSIEKGMSILSLVGRGQQHHVGLAGRMFTVLGNENINIEMISQGASEINVSCVIDDASADRALNAIHEEFVD